MSNQYPGFHTHVENGYPGEKGQKGVGGEKGRPGQEGRITEILFAFSNKTPADLFENTFPKDWDSEGHPKQAITVRPGQSFVYTVDNSIWTHLPQANTAGWLQTGTVNGDIYTVPGDKGSPGDKGQKGEVGADSTVAGPAGSTGPAGAQGDKGAQGDAGGTGPQGTVGDKGQKGEVGAQGLQGTTGGQGPAGADSTVAGPQGDKGATGATGPSGNPFPGGTFSGDITARNIIATGPSGTYNIGSSSVKFGTMYANTFNGTATAAQYADLAENYEADADYEPGTVLVIGGESEVTISDEPGSYKVVGVVSTNPAYLMNSEANGVAVALRGRVPCKVTGNVNKGDVIITGDTPGYGMVAADPQNLSPLQIIGRSLNNKLDAGPGIVEIIV